ncbi:MAG: hypothetical protein AAB339_00120 [Elusimicrobiota bacterium]
MNISWPRLLLTALLTALPGSMGAAEKTPGQGSRDGDPDGNRG